MQRSDALLVAKIEAALSSTDSGQVLRTLVVATIARVMQRRGSEAIANRTVGTARYEALDASSEALCRARRGCVVCLRY